MKRSLLLLGLISAFVSCQSESTQPKETQRTNSTQSEGRMNIAYVRLDSLVENYEYHQELKSQFEKEAKKAETDLQKKAEQFQENVRILEQQARNLSAAELQRHQAELQQKQQFLLQLRDEMTQDLLAREQALNEELRNDLDSILNIIREEGDYDFIFSFEPGGQLLSMDPSFDITPTVVEKLNEGNANRKAAKAKKEE
ncbi:MAG: OmpH family outer membrane protein [Bacteroidota bacterium]|nr:OmpH family outer membrane protein [Bacteroidota bacterium]MDX5429163.1 OmpH family outer membrane protein [Bacteroidota bacterium]MDX5448471.1 OmpH family outer membrane protein [Bacteroidota bacterium]MDX5506801.1 OmpH family outer membrane protein [Bacteroidota bacterium]